MSTTNPQHAQKIALPIDEHLPHIAEQIKSSQNLVITAAPGAGKTTRVPSLLLQIFQGKILILEPRRIAALGAAFRIAEENHWELGGSEIGYQVRFEKKLSDTTRLIFLTEAMLAKKLLKDPELRGIDCIVIDEFHERSLHTDLALGYLRELQILGHPIKLVVMSATLDAQSLGNYLGTQDQPCPIVSSAGRLFPLQIEMQKNSLSLVLHQNFYLSLAETIQKALSKSQRDLLVFLPGVGEIRRAIQACEHLRKDFILAELHGGLDLDEQRQVVLGKTGTGKRRIIFSTNIAESAITIDGVDAVVDCGLEKVAIEDPFTQFTSLELSRISMASAHQRAGRAARQFPGVCFRMWNTLDQQSMPEMPTSEVQCKDLSDAILWLILMGIQDPSRFSWYENPPNYLLETARQKLAMLNLIELQSGLLKATPLGEMVAQIPLTASMARMCLISETSEQAVLAARTAIILDMGLGDRRSGGDQQSENDLWPILEDWKQFPRHHPAAKAVDQILSILRSLPIPSNSVPLNSPSQMTSHEFTEFLCQAIPHLLCRRRSSNDPKADKSPRAILTNGKGMILKDESSVRKSEFFFALSGQARRGQDTLISCAVGIDKSLIFKTLDHQIKTTNETYYDRERQTFYTSSNKYFGSLLLERSAIRKATTQEVGEQLEQIALTELEYLVAQSEPLARLLARFRFLARELELIARDHTELAVIAREVLDSDHGLHEDGFHSIVSNVCYGENSLQAIIQKDWSYFFQDYVGDQIWKLLQDQVPQHVKTPRGKTILIEYPTDRPPFLEIKIQECFGWKSGPRVLFGHIPVRLHLLGPNYRPVQITDDLAGFWKGSYHEVRKELRARYPKHKWPEDPTSLAEED